MDVSGAPVEIEIDKHVYTQTLRVAYRHFHFLQTHPTVTAADT